MDKKENKNEKENKNDNENENKNVNENKNENEKENENENDKENENENENKNENEKENENENGKENENRNEKENEIEKEKEKVKKIEKEIGKEGLKTFNIITLGESGVGKTSIINRYATNQFNSNISSTLGMNFVYKEIHFNNKGKIILKLVDTAGQEKYKSLAKMYFKHADAVLFVFSMEEEDSFNTIQGWMESFKNINNKGNVPQYLVGNKNDLEKKIEQRLIDKFSRENKIPFISTSAKTNNNIDELFEELGKKLYIDFLKKEKKVQNIVNIKIIKKDQKNKCCSISSDA